MKIRNTNQQGFTLIELMIVVAIIGVLAAVAVPAYKDYVTKSEASSAIATLRALQTPAELYIQEHGSLKSGNEGLKALGASQKVEGLGTLAITSDENTNAIEFTFTAGALDAKKITLTRDEGTGWACTTDLAQSVRPKSCSEES